MGEQEPPATGEPQPAAEEPAAPPAEPQQPAQEAKPEEREPSQTQPPQTQPARQPPAQLGAKDNIIYVGKKNVMSYVLAVVTQFNQGSKEVLLKARGNAISRTIDVTQIVKHRFFSSLEITGFKAETEELTREDGSMSRVSSLTLTLTK